MDDRPEVIVFDVNETLSDLSPIADRFAEVGAPKLLAKVWFAGLLRDGFALAASGVNEKFAVIANGWLRDTLTGLELNRDVDAAAVHIMEGFASVGLHPDVAAGVRSLKASGFRLVTLSNGSTTVAEKLLGDAGLLDQFEKLLSVEAAPGWKPVRAAYEYGADACGVQPHQMLLTAVHPWDIHGASSAGLRTTWINRTGSTYPGYFTAPEIIIGGLGELPARLRKEM
ncbi:2-haloacid dehalogenase [Mycetocola sp. CAN_C7]|uniref:haloacid dehalogenase type II n=1 Tax=Mycetocola sp. CAN_C7 TaxID=2787724 RepID=UPI0018CAB3C7